MLCKHFVWRWQDATRTPQNEMNHKSVKWFSGLLLLFLYFFVYQSAFRLMRFRNLFFCIYTSSSYFFFRSHFLSFISRKDRHSGDKMKNKVKPLQKLAFRGARSPLKITKEIHCRNSRKLSADKFVEIFACEYSISKIKLLLLPTVYTSNINCLAVCWLKYFCETERGKGDGTK